MHEGRVYDPRKAHEYYMRNRQLKGRKKASGAASGIGDRAHDLVREIQHPGKTEQKKPQSTEQKLASIKKKLALLAQQRGGGKNDFNSRTSAEKSAASAVAAKKLKENRAAASEQVQAARKEVADLNQALKTRIAAKAPASETNELKSSIDEAKKRLDDAVAKLKDLTKAA